LHTNLVLQTPVYDPLLCQTALPYRAVFYPLGYPVAVTTNYKPVIQAGEHLWGREISLWDKPAVELRLAVGGAGLQPDERPRPQMPRAQGHLLSIVHDAANFAVCNLEAGFGFGWFTPAVATDPAYFRYHFLEPLAYMTLESLYLTQIHGACIALRGQGVLLCGDTHAGKTTLSYACARRGWTYVADDASHLVRESRDRVIVGRPYQIRLRVDARALFPELGEYEPVERPNGKPSLELDTAGLGLTQARQVAARYIVFLNRDTDLQRLSRYSRNDAYDRLSQVICFGTEAVQEEQRQTLRDLLTLPLYQIDYRDLDWAEGCLRSLVENGA